MRATLGYWLCAVATSLGIAAGTMPSGAVAQDAATDPRPEGLFADLVIVPENPIANLKGGIQYTIKDGIVYDAQQLLADVARMVEKQKQERGITRLPAIEFQGK